MLPGCALWCLRVSDNMIDTVHQLKFKLDVQKQIDYLETKMTEDFKNMTEVDGFFQKDFAEGGRGCHHL